MTDPPTPRDGATDTPGITLDRLATRLLYVEDDDDLRDMIGDTFIEAGFDVTAVSSAEAAMTALEGTRFDILVTDNHMSGETGSWLIETASARGHLAHTAAIMLTSDRRSAGSTGYKVLRKPVDFGTLLATISEAVGQTLPAPVVSVGAPRPAEIELVLYVTSTSQESLRAIRNLDRALKPFDKSRYRLTIIDVAHGGDGDWYRSLEDDRVIVTPTLVKKMPGPKTWIVGTLAPIDAVEQMLMSVLGGPQR